MAQKFFDIFPPKKKTTPPRASLKGAEPKPVFRAEEPILIIEENREYEKDKKTKPRKLFLKILVFCFLTLLIFSGIFIFSLFSKTQVEIWPKIEDLALKEKITVDIKKDRMDFVAKIIPGEFFEEERSSSQDFSSSGKALKEEKAKGVIQIYNAFSASPQVLAVSTRFVSADGKLFKALRRVVVPGATYDKGKLVPNSISVEVQAVEAGESYNIGPSAFSIPGFAGTPKYTAFYGKSFSPMTGGLRGEVSQVTQNDLDQAKNSLTGDLKQKSKEFLKNKNSPNFVLLNEALSQEITDSKSSQNAGASVANFTYQAKVKSKWLGFKKEDIKNFVETAIGVQKKLKEESLEVSYSFESIDKESGKMVLTVEIKAKIYPNIDLVELKKSLLGKSFNETKLFLENQPGITKIKVKSPFWKRKIPADVQKVEIRLNVD